jgi:hypothetical protein
MRTLLRLGFHIFPTTKLVANILRKGFMPDRHPAPMRRWYDAQSVADINQFEPPAPKP